MLDAEKNSFSNVFVNYLFDRMTLSFTSHSQTRMNCARQIYNTTETLSSSILVYFKRYSDDYMHYRNHPTINLVFMDDFVQ